jgi:hypothetical protein
VMDARLRVARRQQVVWASVAIDAGCGVHASCHSFRMEAAVVRSLLISMAFGTSDFLRRAVVDRTLDIVVAVNAGKHAAVYGIFKGLWIYIKADGSAIYIMRQRGVAVAGQAVIGSGFRGLFPASRNQANSQ